MHCSLFMASMLDEVSLSTSGLLLSPATSGPVPPDTSSVGPILSSISGQIQSSGHVPPQPHATPFIPAFAQSFRAEGRRSSGELSSVLNCWFSVRARGGGRVGRARHRQWLSSGAVRARWTASGVVGWAWHGCHADGSWQYQATQLEEEEGGGKGKLGHVG